MASFLKLPRGTRADFNTLQSANGLIPNSQYFITDENRLVYALTSNTSVNLPRVADTQTAALVFHLNGGGAELADNQQFDLPSVPFACTVTGWRIIGDQTGSAVIDILRSTYSNFPTMASIAGSEKPTLSSARKNEDNTLSSWTTSLAAGDVLRANVDSATTVEWVTVILFVTRV